MLPTRLRRYLYFLPGLAFLAALLLPGATAASANTPSFQWNVDTYDFGYNQSTYTFAFTNVYPWWIVDYPVPFQNANEFHLLNDACTAPVAPGGSCKVTVGYTPTGKPAADTLPLSFNDLSGKPVSTPSVRLFGGGAEYLTTDYLGNDVTFPPASPARRSSPGWSSTSTASTRSTSFQMPFSDPVSQLPVSVPVVTLHGTAQ